MCGCAGFLGIRKHKTRYSLVSSLGMGIDTRGGHAAGYVNFNGKTLRLRKKLGHWFEAQRSFIDKAASGKVCMMHARYATCGKGEISEAHPFKIKRKGKIVLYGAHNGMVYNAQESAKRHGRKITVDSEEIFELLADEDYEGIKKLEGYGVITWMYPDKPDCIYLLRLSHNSDIFVAQTRSGNIVYGSTEDIVKEALKDAGLRFKIEYDIEVGIVYKLDDKQVWETNKKGIRFTKGYKLSKKQYHRATLPSYLSGNGLSMSAWLEIFKEMQKQRQEEIDAIPDAEIIQEDSIFETTCNNCDDVIDEEEESELEMLFSDMYGSQLSRDQMYCKNCIGI